VLITYRDIEEVSFPVFNLPNGNWQLLDGLLFLDDLILDDKNMRGDTLGKRRLQTPHETLFSLKKSLDSHVRKVERKEVASLLHLNGVKKRFIIPRPPPSDCSWAGVIYIYNMPWMLYDYSPERQKDTRRKI
jgi:hypothetical protein